MSQKDNKSQEEIVKSLASELGMSESEILDLISKSDSEEEDSTEDKKEDVKEEKKEDNKMDESEKKEEDTQKSQKPDIFKSLRKDIKRLTETIEKSHNDDLIKSLVATVESLKLELDIIKSQSDDICKSVDAIGSTSQGVRGVRYSNYLEKGGDKPYTKGDKIVLASTNRDAISEAMFSVIEKSSDDDLKKSMGVDLINYQGSGQLSERAVMTLNKAGFIFREQAGE